MEQLDDNFWKWVDEHLHDDPVKLRLKYNKKNGDIDYAAAITQIECRNKFAHKLHDTLSRSMRFYFPSRLAGEQSTSDRLAEYHRKLIIRDKPIADFTSGLGIDLFHCSAETSECIGIELDEAKADALRYNIDVLDLKNIEVICADCRKFAKTTSRRFGTIFIDPARRAADGSRVFSLADCEPNVIEMLPRLSEICDRLIIKMSPMLDISHTIEALHGCTEIIALGTPTECKELIAVMDFNVTATSPVIKAVTLGRDWESIFSYTSEEENEASMPEQSMPREGDYLFEPFPAVMKLSAQKLLAARYEVKMFHFNTRLYHSHHDDVFPGEHFKIERIIDYASKNIKRLSKEYPQINVAVRNFGMTADALRKKLGVKDGGSLRLIGLTAPDCSKKMLIASPLYES